MSRESWPQEGRPSEKGARADTLLRYRDQQCAPQDRFQSHQRDEFTFVFVVPRSARRPACRSFATGITE
jgi:hypothetical protein